MVKMKFGEIASSFILVLAILLVSLPALGYDITEKFSIGGILAGAYQYQWLDGDENLGRGALPFQPELSFRPTEKDEIFAKFGFAAGNGLNEVSEFNQRPWAADLEDDVKNINGRNRDHLLTAWYRHRFSFGDGSSLGATLGIIDATDYLDDNAFANDEYTQFMNDALVNGPGFFFPSYDAGGALEWDSGPWAVRGVYMNLGDNEEGRTSDYFGAQVERTLSTPLGDGEYRVVTFVTSRDLPNRDGTDYERRFGVLLSLDQELGGPLGAFIRFGWQDDEAAVDYDSILSGGLDINGGAWGRSRDNIGLGFGYLSGGNLDVDKTYVTEGYYRLVLNDFLALTADVQYMKDDATEGDNPKGWILGLRAVTEF